MLFCSVNGIFSVRIFRQPLTIYRYVRNVSRRGDPQLLKGTVKTVYEKKDDDISKISNYQDFIKVIKSSVSSNELAIEKAFTSREDFGEALPKEGELDAIHGKDQHDKILIKKKIIGKKYFKMDLETNLLTYAAKEQIRYLHRTDPTEWTPETLSRNFPVTVKGVIKLLKSNYVLKTSERIKKHDKEVEERWKALESGETSELITPYTKRMWDEGKIMKQNYKSNPNLPFLSANDTKTIIMENEKIPGEFSSIIQQYINYKKEKESSQIKPNAGNELLVSEESKNTFKNQKKVNKFRFNKNKYHVDDETNDSISHNPTNYSKISKHAEDIDVLHSQFTTNLKGEKHSKEFASSPQNVMWIEDQLTVKNPGVSRKPPRPEEIFTKIHKHKKETIDASKSRESAYLYDENLVYQRVKGKIKEGKIDLPYRSTKENALYKVGQCVYDKHGEFLYKIPVKR